MSKFVSRMELFIQDILKDDLKLKYEFDYQFKEFREVYNYEFDFYIENDCIIEFDGMQHFQDDIAFRNRYSHDYKYGICNDNIKNEFCLKQGIPLLRIPYELYPDCTKYTNKQLVQLIRYFMQMHIVPPEIINYYWTNSESNYACVASNLNVYMKNERALA